VATQTLPARLNAGNVPAGLRVGAVSSRPAKLRRVLIAGGSLGGQNAAAIVGLPR
jgi:hypothetical protein